MLFNVKCIDDSWNTVIKAKLNNKLPVKGKIYKATHRFTSFSHIYKVDREYIMLEDYGIDAFTLDSFEIIPNDGIGERAPINNSIPLNGKDMPAVSAYKSNHIF